MINTAVGTLFRWKFMWPAWLTCVLLPALVFWPGLPGPFLFDDFPNLVSNTAMARWLAHQDSLWSVLAAAHAGPLGRPLAVLSLAGQARVWGFDPFVFKVFNLAVHIGNTLLVYWLGQQLLDSQRAPSAAPAPGHTTMASDCPQSISAWALMAALLWALHPLALNPVLYVVQRMSSLSALGVLVALNGVVLAYQRLRAGRSAAAWLWVGVPCAGLVALLAKENALLLPFYLLVLQATLLPGQSLPPAGARSWRNFMRLAGWLPACLAVVLLVLGWPSLVHGFANRDFTVTQRLWTEARVIWLYLGLLAWPRLADLGLYHDDLMLSTSWWTPLTTLPAVLGLVLVSALAWRWRSRQPWWSFAWGFVLASQLLESTVVPLELMHEHRMYLAMVAPVLAMVASLRQGLIRTDTARHGAHWRGLDRVLQGTGSAALMLPLLVVLAGVTELRVQAWRNPLILSKVEAAHHPDSLHAVYDVANLYADLAERTPAGAERQRLFELAEGAGRRALAIAPGNSKPWVGLILLCSEAGCTPPPDSFAHLQAILRQGPRADLMAADLRAMVRCRVQRVCALDSTDLRRSLQVLALNPGLNAQDRQLIAEQLADLARFDARAAGGGS